MKRTIFRPLVIIFALWFFLLGMNSCNPGDDIELPFSAALFGNWNWVESVGGFAPRKITPETQGYTVQYRFMLYGEFEEFRDDKPFVKSHYSVKRQQMGSSAVDMLVLDHNPSVANVLRFLGNDTLKLTEYCFDCYQHTFVRVK
ncbi:MAG: hypothetical protein HY089_05685 [Ignavibacteriales bacterium]|nr:hypothetical protein [Ignavibacteriales bacterium]